MDKTLMEIAPCLQYSRSFLLSTEYIYVSQITQKRSDHVQTVGADFAGCCGADKPTIC